MTPTARSRRERPSKRSLSREWIVAETIKIMQAEGLAKATMRRVAQALDTGPASLYVYVANTTELHAAVLEELIGTLPPKSSRRGAWRTRLLKLLKEYSELLYAHPGLARSALMMRPTGPNALRLYDEILGLLLDGGVPTAQAAWGVDLLLQYVTANATEHSNSTPAESPARDERGPNGLEQLSAGLHDSNPKAAPHVAAHADLLVSGTPDQRFTWAIDTLLHGIAATATPTQ